MVGHGPSPDAPPPLSTPPRACDTRGTCRPTGAGVSRDRRVLGRRALLLASLVLALLALAALQPWTSPFAIAAADMPHEEQEPGPLTLAWMRVRGPPTVALQVGHLHASRHPDELAKLRTSTGAHVDGVDEVDVNLAVAHATAARLEAQGIRVEVLPATVPPRYRADLLLALHADASLDPTRRGYKSSHARVPRNALEPRLDAAIDAAYFEGSSLPDDHANVSGAMLDYYAFASRHYVNSAHRATPALIVEMGYLSHPDDRRWLLGVDGPAEALAEGVRRYLASVGRWHPRAAPEPLAVAAPDGT